MKPGARRRGSRAVVLSFALARPGPVVFYIRREAPDCRFIGTFRIRGQAGVNRVPFRGRFRGRPLPAGTYTISVVAVRGGRRVQLGSVAVVIVPRGRDLTDARPARSTCPSRDGGPNSPDVSSGVAAGGSAGSATAARESETVAGAAAAAKNSGRSDTGSRSAEAGSEGAAHDSRLLGVVPNPFAEAPGWLQSLLLIALGAAVGFLLLASLPTSVLRPAGTTTALFVRRRRAELALAGATMLSTVAIAALAL